MNGNWGHWQHWATCSASCGGGTRHRIRECNSPSPANGGNDCDGEMHQTDYNCNDYPCPKGPSELPKYNIS